MVVQARARAESFGFRLDLSPPSRPRKGQPNKTHQSLLQEQTTNNCPGHAETWLTCRDHWRNVELHLSYNIRTWLQPSVVPCHGNGSGRSKTLYTAECRCLLLISSQSRGSSGLRLELMEDDVFMPEEAVEECTDEDDVLLVCLPSCFVAYI